MSSSQMKVILRSLHGRQQIYTRGSITTTLIGGRGLIGALSTQTLQRRTPFHTSSSRLESTSSHRRTIGHQYNNRSRLLPVLFIAGTVIGFSTWQFNHGLRIKNDVAASALPPVLPIQSPPAVKNQTQSSSLSSSPPTTTPPDEKNEYSLSDWRGTPYPALDLDSATAKLRLEESTTKLFTSSDLSPTRFDSTRVPSNSPTEDEKSYHSLSVGKEGEDWKFWGVYDGHAGWATSWILRSWLPEYVARSIKLAAKKDINAPNDDNNQDEAIENAIKAGFVKLDDEITADAIKALTDEIPHAEAVARIAPARAGSCALLSVFDPVNAVLRVACTGDSRAVLGRRKDVAADTSSDKTSTTSDSIAPVPPSGSSSISPSTSSSNYTTLLLSQDQTGHNPSENSRLTTLHPNEPNLLDPKSGRILGLAIVRAFGDHRWKWTSDQITTCQTEFYGPAPRPNYISPPYLTAEPVVTTTKIQKGDFLIMASDGLWDHMSSEDAVECVGRWVERYRPVRAVASAAAAAAAATSTTTTSPPSSSAPSSSSSSASSSSSTAPTESPTKRDVKQPKKTEFNYWYKSTPENFVVEDPNCATHLVRNALGGDRRELFVSLLTVRAPESRAVRDDITVQVVFF